MRAEFCLLMFLVAAVGASGASYVLDPSLGAMSNPGTPAAPWGSLESVAKAGRPFLPGDELVLRSGFHGRPDFRGRNPGPVTIRPAPGADPVVAQVTFRAAANWVVVGLSITAEAEAPLKRATLVRIDGESTGIRIEGCRIRSVEDVAEWSAEDWNQFACNGIDVAGDENLILGNSLRNVNFGISVSGERVRVANNTIENFSGDGLRGLGDYGVFEYNTVKNCYDVNGNHDDGFQSYSRGPDGVGTAQVRGVILRGNRILNYEDPNQPFRGTLQGIGCFDGFFEDWIIENNEILVDHWHGITLAGARRCRILHNTVVDLNDRRPGPPWIRIGAHKNGTPSEGNVVKNNLASAYALQEGVAVAEGNQVAVPYADRFRDYPNRNLRLHADSPAVDAGVELETPSRDIAGNPRPLDGNGDGDAQPDPGAHEFRPGATVPSGE